LTIIARTQVEGWVRAKVDPSDLVQQTFLDAYRGFETFKGESSSEWLGWLRRILATNAVDFARRFTATEKRQVRREMSLDQNRQDARLNELADERDTPSKELLAHERELLVAEALHQLDDDHREVILLRNLQGLPFEEVARQMNRSRAAAQMLWLRAIRNLKKILDEEPSGV
jgi:RNA polymerase sigma-70 factor (ECF subfamily)